MAQVPAPAPLPMDDELDLLIAIAANAERHRLLDEAKLIQKKRPLTPIEFYGTDQIAKLWQQYQQNPDKFAGAEAFLKAVGRKKILGFVTREQAIVFNRANAKAASLQAEYERMFTHANQGSEAKRRGYAYLKELLQRCLTHSDKFEGAKEFLYKTEGRTLENLAPPLNYPTS